MYRRRLLRLGVVVLLAAMVLSLMPGAALAQGGPGYGMDNKCGASHKVAAGDTLSQIAKDNGISVGALMEANHLSDADLIVIDQVLCIPAGMSKGPDKNDGMVDRPSKDPGMYMEPVYGNGYTPRGKSANNSEYLKYFDGMEGGSFFLDEKGRIIKEKEEDALSDLLDTAEAKGYTTFVDAVKAAGLEKIIRSGTYTIFVPSNQAFAKLPARALEGLLKSPDALLEILLYHVVVDELFADDIKDGSDVATVEGSSLHFQVKHGQVTVNKATVIKSDIEADNGVIHVINEVLMPMRGHHDKMDKKDMMVEEDDDDDNDNGNSNGDNGGNNIIVP